MKQKDSSSRAPFDPTASVPDYRAPIAPEAYAPLVFPKYPSVQEVLQHRQGLQEHPLVALSDIKPPSSPPSIFDSMLGGNLDVLANDVDRNPDRYTATERAFMDELRSRQKDLKALTRDDAQTLSQMVYNFAALRPPKHQKPEVYTPPTPKKKKPALMRDEDELPDGREPQVDMTGEAPAYWWVG